MKITPMPLNSVWASRIRSATENPRKSLNAVSMRDVPTEASVELEHVDVLHHGSDVNFRPYLHLRGKIVEMTPDVELPYGVESLVHSPKTGPAMDVFYEFTDDQLADLVEKGYFSKEFAVPETMTDYVWDFPVKADYYMVYPEYDDQVPLVFAEVQNRRSVVMDIQSGYELSEYFKDVGVREHVRDIPGAESQYDNALEQDAVYEVNTAPIKDIFADVDFTDAESTYEQQQLSAQQQAAGYRDTETTETTETTPESLFDQLLSDADKHREAYEQKIESELREDPESVERSYYDSVAPHVEEALAQQRRREAADALVSALDHDAGSDQDQQDAAEQSSQKKQQATQDKPRKMRGLFDHVFEDHDRQQRTSDGPEMG